MYKATAWRGNIVAFVAVVCDDCLQYVQDRATYEGYTLTISVLAKVHPCDLCDPRSLWTKLNSNGIEQRVQPHEFANDDMLWAAWCQLRDDARMTYM